MVRRGRSVDSVAHLGSSGSFWFARFIRVRWVHSGASWGSLGSFLRDRGVVELILERSGGRSVNSGVLRGSLFSFGFVGLIRRSVLLGSLISFGSAFGSALGVVGLI